MSNQKHPYQLGLPLLPPPSDTLYLLENHSSHGDEEFSWDSRRISKYIYPISSNSVSRFETYTDYLQEFDRSWQDYASELRAVERWKTSYPDVARSHFRIFSKWSREPDYVHERSIHVVFERNAISRMTIALFSIFLSSAAMSLIFSALDLMNRAEDFSISVYIALSISVVSGIACSERTQKELNRKSA